MSVKAVGWVLDELQGLKPGPSLVMLALADYADERNSCYPGQDKIAARARCSKRSVVTYLKELEELGLITVRRRTFSDGSGSIRRSSNRYFLHLDQTYPVESAKFAPTRKSPGQLEDANSALTREPDENLEGANSALTRESAGQLVDANSALTREPDENLEGAKYPTSKVQPVALNEPPVIEPPVPPSPQPPTADPGDSPSDPGSGEGAAAPRGASPGGSAGVDGSSAENDFSSTSRQEPASATAEDWRIVTSAIPAAMRQDPGPAGVAVIASLVRERLDDGWTVTAIHAALGAWALPDEVKNMTALVIHRLVHHVAVEDFAADEAPAEVEHDSAEPLPGDLEPAGDQADLPDADAAPGAGDPESADGGVDDVDDFDEQVALAREVLPVPMQAMGPRHLAKVGQAVAERVDAGWSKTQITQVLESRELPTNVRNLVALVLARLRDDVPVDAPPPGDSGWVGAWGDSPEWSHTLADGRVITRRDLDFGLLAVDFAAARRSGEWEGDDRLEFAVASGIERYLVD